MKNFDLIIIGGGAGAFAAAIRANELSAEGGSASGGKVKTAMINTGLPLGGTCLNVGCVPSKTLLWAGEVMHHAQNHGIPGIDIEVKNFDFQKVVQDELSLVEKLREEKYEKVLNSLVYVTFINGKAAFISPKEVVVNGEKISAEKFIIAAGSTANVPPIAGIREVGFVTHIEAFKMPKQPKELVVIGAGPIGLEFAQMFSRFGAKVTILQRGPSIFPHSERELTDKLEEILTKEGITIKTNVEVQKAYLKGDKKVLVYKEADLSSVALAKGDLSPVALAKGDEILLAAGKTPNTEYLDLEKAGVKINERKAIIVNDNFQTNVSYIYAIGDVAALPLRLETTAGREGTLAAENAFEGTQNSIDYNSVPYAIFTDPQIGSVGLTDAEALKQGIKCSCRTISFEALSKAQIIRKTEGLIKMIINADTKEILGVHILAPNAGDLIAHAMVLIQRKMTIDEVINSLPVFPTMSEAIKLVALSFTKDISKLSCCI